MNWYYESAGQQQGPVSEIELERLIAEGRITPNTLVWREGMPDWRPLREARPTPPPVELVAPGAGIAAPAADTVQCGSCGRFVPTSEVIQIGDRRICAACKPAVLQGIQQGAGVPSVADFQRNGPAWEQRDQLGIPKAAWETVKGVLTQPAETFSSMKREGGLGSPLGFLLLVGGVGFLAGFVYNVLFQGTFNSAFTSMGVPTNPRMASTAYNLGVAGAGLVLAPVILVLMAFIYSGVNHLMLMMMNGANQPYETSFRVVCYSLGAGSLLNIVPFCGGTIGVIWSMVAAIIGLAKAHETTSGKGAAAVLVPTVLCCGSLAVFYGFIIYALVSNGGHLPTQAQPPQFSP